jgi:hypothetical protein
MDGVFEATAAFGSDGWKNYAMVKDMLDEVVTLVQKVPEWKKEFTDLCGALTTSLGKVESGTALKALATELEDARSAKHKLVASCRSKAKGIKAAIGKKDKEKSVGLACVQLDGAEDVHTEKGTPFFLSAWFKR